ncbi:DUF2537 domain-containing protein [Mycolicibacterium sp. CBMA 361]|uniref:DUF2537 domain-containing protein n=1 Tax=Mycolicibacterium sp. CBMA 361 TaxID=2606610 RepID=UPI0012DF3B82|nr:DUF2537 domain-containing protein [Mycolicibacterium sp. CBMA 361]MUM35859.1 DUF2537 domain-containing protein [Mycolicibacterium sp. CBMA 361]
MTQSQTPWGTGVTVSVFVAALTAVAIVVLTLGLLRVHPLLAVALNAVAVGGLAPTQKPRKRKPEIPAWEDVLLGVRANGQR